MSRRTRKVKANKIYQQEHNKKTLAIAQVSINLAIGISKLLLNPNPSTTLEIMTIIAMSKEQQRFIISQPLNITKPDKYGKFKDYRIGGVVINVQ